MQLKIEINLPKDQISPTVEQPAPFDPVKIRNFVFFLIILLSLVGYGVYELWFNESDIEIQHHSTTSKSTINAVSTKQQETARTISTATPENTTSTDTKIVNQENIHVSVQESSTIKPEPEFTSNEPTAPQENVLINDTSTPIEPSQVESTSTTLTSIDTPTKPTQELDNTPTRVIDEVTETTTQITPTNNIKNLNVKRAQLTSSIESREPTNRVSKLNLQEQTKLYLFTEIHNMANQKVFHHWKFKQQLMAEITLNIGSNSWRTYSSKNFDETMIGQWTVEVVDEQNKVLTTVAFEVTQ